MEIKFDPNLNASLRVSARSPRPPVELPTRDRADFENIDRLDRSMREIPVVRPEVLAKIEQFRSEKYPPEKMVERLSVFLAGQMPANSAEEA